MSSILSRLISPLPSSTQQEKQRAQQGFKRFQKEETPKLALVKNEEPTAGAQPSVSSASNLSTPGHTPLTAAVLELFEMLRSRKLRLMRWLGFSAYKDAARTQRRSKLFRKGAMLDRQA